MSIQRLITRLAPAKLFRCPRYVDVHAIDVTSSNSTCLRKFCNETYVGWQPHRILTNDLSLLCRTLRRYKTTKKKNRQKQDEDSDEDELEEEEELSDVNGKVITTNVKSMRIDLVLKTTLAMSRTKAEIALYASKIRINGEKVLKKSATVGVDDTIDLIRGPSPQNPDFLVVSRVTILSVTLNESDGFRIKFTRDKSLLIDNYEEEWTPIDS